MLDTHEPRNGNEILKEELLVKGFNARAAVVITKIFNAMPTFWLVFVVILSWIIANSTFAHFDAPPFPLLLTLASIPQLPLMIVIMVGQEVIGRNQELQTEEEYRTMLKMCRDMAVMVKILDLLKSEIAEIRAQVKS